ncbi:MAG: alpha/beta hydrolase, partial [Methyloceanibacter sp.]|nr:alpha/beta hydrolase [Methyloceanibacter sp.]
MRLNIRRFAVILRILADNPPLRDLAVDDLGRLAALAIRKSMTLVATPKNPIPLGAQTGYLEIRKNLRLRYASWQSALKERSGTVCIFPGRNEFIEKYFEVVSELRRRGFAVAVLDWRGQGGSSRLTRNPLKGHVRNFADYEEDLTHFMKGVVLPDCPTPYFALGHSMSAAVLFRAATKRGGWFSRMVMTSPMIEILNLPFSQKRCAQITEGLALCGFGKRAVPARKKDIHLPVLLSKATSSFVNGSITTPVRFSISFNGPPVGHAMSFR